MEGLLDTHTFFWFAQGNPSLSIDALMCLMNGKNTLYLSVASIWEMSIKMSLVGTRKQFEISQPLDIFLSEQLRRHNITLLSIEIPHVQVVSQLPLHKNHNDPFDRMIIAQSLCLKIPIIGVDTIFDDYEGVQRIW